MFPLLGISGALRVLLMRRVLFYFSITVARENVDKKQNLPSVLLHNVTSRKLI